MDKEFCILDEPWIKVLDKDNMIREVSLHTLFKNAHQYKKLAGETATQDIAILRVLLAITITVFYRYSADGTADNVLDYDEPEEVILERWADYWENGSFKWEIFYEYLEEYRERFYLFHPDTPFWQVANLEEGTDYGVINLYGNVKESNNKYSKHHFHMIDGEYIDSVDYSEIVRWIIYNNAFSVNVKTKVNGENRPTGVGRLGQLGLIYVDANNLFEKIMLNLCALNSHSEAWGEPNPIWEQETRRCPGVELVTLDNLPQLYTIQSRRLLLRKENKRILGFKSIGGDYYNTQDDLLEPMTLLKWDGKEQDHFKPKKHDKEIAAWREFPCMFIDEKLTPGIVKWIKELLDNELYPNNKLVTFCMLGLEYGDGMSYTNGELINQSLLMSKELLINMGKIWVNLIINQIEKCENVEKRCYHMFAKNLASVLYKGDKNGINAIKEVLSSEYYFKIDNAFREWLISINSDSKRNMKEKEWEDTSYGIAETVIKEYIAGLPQNYSLLCAKAFGKFKRDINLIYPKEHNKGGENYGN